MAEGKLVAGKIYAYLMGENVAADPDAATYIWIDSDQCIRWVNCINISPVDANSLRKCDCKTDNMKC